MFGGTGNLFGQKPTTSTPQGTLGSAMFGTPTSMQSPFGTGTTTTFGASATPSFGTGTTPSFGATPQLGSGAAPQLGTGAAPQLGTGVPAFGATATPGFGAATTPAFGGSTTPAFGANATPAFGAGTTPSFGATTTPAFGTSATPSFGATPIPNQTVTSAQPTLNFGFPQISTTATGLSFPQVSQAAKTQATSLTPSTTQPSLNFGLGSNLTKPAFGATTTTATTGFSFNTATTTTAPTLGLSLQSTTSAPTFGLGTSVTATTSAQSTLPGFSLGASPFKLPTTTATTTASSLGTGLIAATPTTTASLGLGALPQTTTSQAGVNPLSSLPSLSMSQSQKSESIKDRPVPPELITLIETLREFVKTQKGYSSEMSQASLKPVLKVSEDADVLKRMMVQLERDVAKNRVQNKKLRTDLTRSIQDCEIVQRLSANQRGFPCDNSIAFEYFQNIIDRFQTQAETLSTEMKNMERHVTCRLNPVPFTPEELAISMKRLYECFVALAGRYQAIHSSITALKSEVKRRKIQ